MNTTPYRPHNPGHDYYDAGIYLVTLVTQGRQDVLGRLCDNPRHPAVLMTDTGQAVYDCWEESIVRQREKGHDVESLGQVIMPDHWHCVIKINQRMDISLGNIIQAFKSACTSRWRSVMGLPSLQEVSVLPLTAKLELPQWLREKAAQWKTEGELIRHLSAPHRKEYYRLMNEMHEKEKMDIKEDANQATHSGNLHVSININPHSPLFDANYDDTICMSDRQREAMIAYVNDNPRRAIIRRCYPQFMERRLHVIIDGVDYAAFGNLFLLRWARKEQVFCHRKARYGQLTPQERQNYGYTFPASDDMTTNVRYEETSAFGIERQQWTDHILEGATVLVTPGISRGEQIMKSLCIEQGFPLIHLQKEPIGRYWKPERSRFEACANGRLLILAPWSLDDMDEVKGVPSATDYSRFHNMNILAENICAFHGDARIVGI